MWDSKTNVMLDHSRFCAGSSTSRNCAICVCQGV
jgi:hypothetical protein